MSDTRYRISDQGTLVYWCDKECRWTPIDCGDYQRYCGEWCRYFRVNGCNVELNCAIPNTVIEVEE